MIIPPPRCPENSPHEIDTTPPCCFGNVQSVGFGDGGEVDVKVARFGHGSWDADDLFDLFLLPHHCRARELFALLLDCSERT